MKALLTTVLAVLSFFSLSTEITHKNLPVNYKSAVAEDSLIDQEFMDEIKREADSIMSTFEDDPNDWPIGTETSSYTVFNFILICVGFIVILLIVAAYLLHREKKRN